MKFNKAIFVLASAMLLASCGGGNTPVPGTSSSTTPSETSKSSETEPVSSSEEPSTPVETEDSGSSESTPVVPSSSSSEAPHEGPYFPEDHKVKIEFMSNSSYGDNIDSYIKAFNQIEPGIEIVNTKESASYQGVIDKVIEGIPVNNYPDIVMGYPDAIEQIMEVGKVLKLDDYINNKDYGWSEDDLADIIETYMEEGRSYPRKGTWSVPFSKSTEAMFYNKDVLVGLDLSERSSLITISSQPKRRSSRIATNTRRPSSDTIPTITSSSPLPSNMAMAIPPSTNMAKANSISSTMA